MSKIHFTHRTTLTPEQYIAGLTDFGKGRSEIFSNSADDYLKVHSAEGTEADVTEGSGGVWERLHYDWSNPQRVVLQTTDSNTWGGASGYTYTFPHAGTGRPTSTWSSSARARTRRASSSPSCSARSARACSRSRS